MRQDASTGPLNLLIGGEAGQGLVTIGDLLARALVRSGYFICVTQSYQSRIRGGHNTYAIRFDTDDVLGPQEPVDLLVALDADTVALHRAELTPRGAIVLDEAFDVAEDALIKVPFKQLASGRQLNVAALGVVGALLGLEEPMLARLVDETFGRKDEKVAEANRQALGNGFSWAAGRQSPLPRLRPPADPPARIALNGNEAIALGALSAGLKFYSFYPMTPSTSVGLTVIKHADQMGVVAEQAEDEIAAINMAIGASFAGAPSMVATSGGGFALMVEGVSLAGMTETPVVIVVAQRPAPATGLPTRTEQADLEFVLHAGHGEFPRAIFAPGTVEECFHLTRRAFDLAERFQSPIFVLTDQFLADSTRAVEPFAVENLPSVKVGHDGPVAPPYVRHAITPDGVSPRLLPGRSEHLVVTDSDEHTEDGHLTEDLAVRVQMVDKRLRKGEGIRAEVVPPELRGDADPELLLVCWGSTKGAVLEAAGNLRADGLRVAVLHFSQVWPLVPEHFLPTLQAAKEVVCVEGNATGQLARLIRRETGFQIARHVRRYDGLPMTAEYVLRVLA
jgi:2-oxoglutarate ferredoxin oxidoreductase subunit alpha